MAVEITASIMCADLLNLGREIRELEEAGVHYFHYDIMDGHFVPNITLGLSQIREIQKRVKVTSDFHLLTSRPEEIIPLLQVEENDLVSFHFTGTEQIDKCLTMIADMGAKAGIVLDTHISFVELRPYLQEIDFVNLMMIRPGFAGQQMMPGMLDKIQSTRRWLNKKGRKEIKIMVDGNVTYEHARIMAENGADILVAGTSSLFSRKQSFAESMAAFQRASGFCGRA